DYFGVGKRHCRVLQGLRIKTFITGFFPVSRTAWHLLGKNPVSELRITIKEIRTRQCRFPTINLAMIISEGGRSSIILG
ncbi:MAG TPA: hypothetical protein VIQ31_33585, partial [Phormidium sp.]